MGKTSTASALDLLGRYGIKSDENGDWKLPKDAVARVRRDQLARVTMSSFPSTPRYFAREGGGMAVRKGQNLGSILSFTTLRTVREKSPMFQAIHSARHHQVRRMAVEWSGRPTDIGVEIVHRHANRPGFVEPEGFDKWRYRFAEVLHTPSKRYGFKTLAAAMTALEEDLLTINRPAVEVLRSGLDPERVVGWRPIDGALIWNTLAFAEHWYAENPVAWGSSNLDPSTITLEDRLELLSMTLDWDFTGADYCLVRDGMVEAIYRPGDLIVAPIPNRTSVNLLGYYPSNVEQSLEIGLTFLNAFNYNGTYFTKGMLSEFVLGISGDIHDDDIDAFVDQLREASQGVRRAWQPPILPMPIDGVLQKIDIKPSNKDMMFEVFLSLLISLGTAIYRMDTNSLNAKPWDGGGGASLSAPNREKEISLAQEEGLHSDLQWIGTNILDELAERCHPDLRVRWRTGDVDEEREARIYEVRTRTDMTFNEVRLARGEKSRGFYLEPDAYDKASDEDQLKHDENPWNLLGNPQFAQAIQQAKMRDMMDQGGSDADGFGDPQGGPGGGSPFGQPPPGLFGGPEAGEDDQEPPQGPPGPPGPQQPMQKASALTIRDVVAHRRRRRPLTITVEQ